MKQDIAKRWVEALRSGEFWQTTGTLETDEKTYCCLGVLCVLAEREGVTVHRQSGGTRIEGDNLADQPAVREWAGIGNDNGTLHGGVMVNGATVPSLAELNDGGTYKGVTAPAQDFNQIASTIEQRWADL